MSLPGRSSYVAQPDARSLADVLAEGLRDQGMAVDIARDGLEAAAKVDVTPTTWSSSTGTGRASTATPLCQMITERDERVMVLMLTAAASPSDGVSAWA